MGVKITIAVEKTANDQDLERWMSTVVTKGECDFYFSSLNSKNIFQDLRSKPFPHNFAKPFVLYLLNFSRRPRNKSPGEAAGDSNSENFKRSYEERNRDSDRYRERETRNRH